MHMQQQELDFFLGALSPTGFSSYYTQVVKDAETQTSALLKAGPGCGKSTLLRRIAAHLEEQGETVELIHCSSDPDSLDGVICGARKFSVVDATPPHGAVHKHTFSRRIYNVIFNYCRIHCECLKFDFFGKTSIAFAQKQVRGFVFMLHAVLCGQNIHRIREPFVRIF